MGLPAQELVEAGNFSRGPGREGGGGTADRSSQGIATCFREDTVRLCGLINPNLKLFCAGFGDHLLSFTVRIVL